MINSQPGATPLSFTKAERLLHPNEFKRVFDNPIKKIHSEHLLLFIQTGVPEQTQARLGLAITKKKVKLAVMRNRLKRLSREIFRHTAPTLGSVDVVLIVKKSYAKKTDLNDELTHIFEKLAILFPAISI
ncbi:ribonuclease P protein component [Moraxella nonliquefaciens]|jgi:ribonuclease P protein component|uniref:Ribonuclease P protein component n=1 Tax=Moraxella nonliquefaciens TaxID=478 RepID=A0A1B8PJQ4_MORNO|nr:ribonuclease P protein component [Moraxella nonliquefaciens]OBX50812.1 ribonuclease P protein component [Moraxella nonliquefaciens]